jgi:hypothetical protein
MYFRSSNLSDSSDLSSSEEVTYKREHKKLKSHHVEDRATSKFYTKDESQEDLPYVADNVYEVKKKIKNYKKNFKKSLHSKDKSKQKVCINCFVLL